MTKNVLITGCSSGIGYHTAKHLDELGYTVVACCRKNKDLQKLESENIKTILLDLNDSNSIQIGFEQALDHFNGHLDILINNAAFAQAGAIEDLNRNELKEQFETNVFGLCELSNLAIKSMRQQSNGMILNIGSILGIVAIPFKGAYVASKFALEGLTDTLRLELSQTPINVVLLDPGPVESNFRMNAKSRFQQTVAQKDSFFKTMYSKALSKTGEEKLAMSVEPQSVAKKIAQIIRKKKPKPRYFITLPAYGLMIAKRILPTKLLDKILVKII